ncbi:MAG: nitrogenase component 1 [Oscillospiraceae bacterium]|nr:nitrogenase component 1 [Oscillospiraceae bacterium]
MNKTPISYTVRELCQRGTENIPPELVSNTHLIYSSPATLAFNSPGAEGFGVKRAGLAIPGSVMLLVAPGCCGRNTSLISSMPEYNNRFFYLMMDETDIVTGRHLKKIPEAVEEVCNFLPNKPSVVMICITCVDALLGTDMERVCRRAEEQVGLPVRPCYMYALTREGRKPPMVHVRQSLYSLLEPRKKKGTSVNLLGFFAPLEDDCELYQLLRQVGVKAIREISRCEDYEEYQKMAEANFNLVLNPEARFAAQDFEKRLGIPSIELTRLYEIDKIGNQYAALGAALGVAFPESPERQQAQQEVEKFRNIYGPITFCIGECMNGDSFELALALVRYGFRVSEIYGTLTAENHVYLRRLEELSPETRVFSNLEPTMLYYDCSQAEADLTIGKDSGYYHPACPNVPWNQDRQPFGYAGVRKLFEALGHAMEEGRNHK